jgi:7-cyano-7-deazaguanine reductase
MQEQKDYSPPYEVVGPDAVRTDMLTVLEYAYHRRREIAVTITNPEYTSVCPMTGLPDTGTITITYVPDARIVELKSLKYYLLQYRNVGIFYEDTVNRILDDLAAALSPKSMHIAGEFTARGGISTRVEAAYEKGEEREK